MLVVRFGWLLAASTLFLPGCFSEPKSELPPGCSLGQHLCPCNDGECDPGLTCHVQIDFCVAIDCEVGALECPCSSEGACNPTLECNEYKYCVPADGTASTAGTDSDSDSIGTMSASMSAGVTSESDSDATTMSTTTPVDPDTSVTDSDPTTTDSDPSDSDPSDSDPSTSTTRAESSSSTDDPSMTTAMTDSDAESSSTGIDPDPSISSTAVVTESDSDSLVTTDMTSSSSSSTASSSSTTMGGETGEFPDCQQCVEDAQSSACALEWGACEATQLCSNNIDAAIACMQDNGGSDDSCPCANVPDPTFMAFTMCLSANCANECMCY